MPDDSSGVPLADALVRALRALDRTAAQAAARRRDPVDRAATHLLLRLVHDGPQRTTALAQAALADASTVSRHVGHLVAEGLVERTVDPSDGRATLLKATDAGCRHVLAVRARNAATVGAVVQDWTDADRAAFARLLDRFTGDLERRRPDVLALADDAPATAPATAPPPPAVSPTPATPGATA